MNKRTYKEIIKKMIKKSFPLLRNSKIEIRIVYNGDFSACVRKNWGTYILIINRKYDIYNKYEIVGLLAHELCHLEDWKIKGKIYYIKSDLLCNLSSKYKEKYEKLIDRIAISKGYSKELRTQRIKRATIKDKAYLKNKRYYLSPAEIK